MLCDDAAATLHGAAQAPRSARPLHAAPRCDRRRAAHLIDGLLRHLRLQLLLLRPAQRRRTTAAAAATRCCVGVLAKNAHRHRRLRRLALAPPPVVVVDAPRRLGLQVARLPAHPVEVLQWRM
jgi:hypothetical protein